MGGRFLLNVADKNHSSDLSIDTLIQLSFQETPNVAKTTLLLNAEDSLHLAINYENCVDCPITVKSFALYYQSSLLKSAIISGQGF